MLALRFNSEYSTAVAIEKSWLSRKIWQPLVSQLKQGSSPRQLAWSVALGGAIGLLPILGVTTLLSGAVGALFRLNHVAMQTINYLAYLPQIALIPVFIRLGEKITGATPLVIDLIAMKTRFFESPILFFEDFGLAAWHGLLAWLVLLPIPTWFVAKILDRTFTQISSRLSKQSDANNR